MAKESLDGESLTALKFKWGHAQLVMREIRKRTKKVYGPIIHIQNISISDCIKLLEIASKGEKK